jgi:NADPH2 dehydrogenase
MYSCNNEDGKVTPFHKYHYVSRAMGGVGLVMLEASAVSPQGRISSTDLGIWEDNQINGLKELVDDIHKYESKVGIQISFAGRKSRLPARIVGPSPVPLTDKSRIPKELTTEDIVEIVSDFQKAAKRAEEAGFDVIELHGAHGYLIHQFLSPLSNKRIDYYGGDLTNRSRFLIEVVEAIREVWKKPLFVRISANEYDDNGNSKEDYVKVAEMLKRIGVDLVDCSSGGPVPKPVKIFPGYQTYMSEHVRTKAGIPTAAVGLITTGRMAEMILENEAADLVFVGRELLRNPYWAQQAARELTQEIQAPHQYERAWRKKVQL